MFKKLLVNSSFDSELNGENFIPAHQLVLSGEFEVDRKVGRAYSA